MGSCTALRRSAALQEQERNQPNTVVLPYGAKVSEKLELSSVERKWSSSFTSVAQLSRHNAALTTWLFGRMSLFSVHFQLLWNVLIPTLWRVPNIWVLFFTQKTVFNVTSVLPLRTAPSNTVCFKENCVF